MSSRIVKRGDIQRRCINCTFAVPRQQQIHFLDDLSHSGLNILSTWIAPEFIINGGILCHECYLLIQPHMSSDVILTPEFGHQQVCFVCGISILRSQAYKLSTECPERNVMLSWTPAHQVSRLERVCAACWRSANREVQRQLNHDAKQPVMQAYVSIDKARFGIPLPPPLPPQIPVQHSRSAARPTIISLLYKRAATTSSCCMFTGCQEQKRLLVPTVIREMILIHNKFYVLLLLTCSSIKCTIKLLII